MDSVNVRIDDREVQDYLRIHGPRKVNNALRSAIRTTTTWAEKETEKRLAIATDIPVNVFKRFRVKKRITGGNALGGVEQGLVWSGYNPIKARFVGKMSQQDFGATAGAYYFAGGFVATMRGSSGITAIFKRRGRKRTPIDEQRVNIPQAEAITAIVADDAGLELVKRFRVKFSEG